jgi:hypothetical protein
MKADKCQLMRRLVSLLESRLRAKNAGWMAVPSAPVYGPQCTGAASARRPAGAAQAPTAELASAVFIYAMSAEASPVP